MSKARCAFAVTGRMMVALVVAFALALYLDHVAYGATGRQAGGQVALVAPSGHRVDGDLGEWDGLPVSRQVEADGRLVNVWIAQGEAGLVVAGRFVGGSGPPAIAPGAAGFAARVDIRIADAAPPTLPGIGWGNQFGQTLLPDEDACEPNRLDELTNGGAGRVEEQECRRWYREQVAYRVRLTELLERSWWIEEAGIGERITRSALPEPTLAPPVFGPMVGANHRAQLATLAPETAGAPQHAFGNEGFEIVIPWAAWPPVSSLRIEGVRLRVGIAGADPVAAAAAAELDAPPLGEADLVVLPEPRTYTLTRCGLPLEGIDPALAPYFGHVALREDSLFPGLFFPTEGLAITQVLHLQNEAQGYAYAPAGSSPAVNTTDYFDVDITADLTLCGPRLALVQGAGETRLTSFTVLPGVQTRETAAGLYVAVGPRVTHSYYGSGQCGGCPRVAFDIYRVTAEPPAAESAFSFLEIADEVREIDIHTSPDGGEIRVYRARPTEDFEDRIWSLTVHCLDAGTGLFAVCDERDGVPAPEPRLIDIWRER